MTLFEMKYRGLTYGGWLGWLGLSHAPLAAFTKR